MKISVKLITLTLISLIIIFIIFIIILNSSSSLTGEVIYNTDVSNTFTHTRAICNKNNYCQDYIITCDNQTVIDIKPIPEAAAQNPLDWEDPRDKEIIDDLCKLIT